MVDLLIPAIVVLPMIGFLITAVIGRRLDKQAHIVPVGVVVIAWLFAMVVVVMALSHAAPFNDEAAGFGYTIPVYTWIPAGDFQVNLSFHVDALTACLLIVVTTIGMLVHIYSIGYMSHDAGYWRFFAYLNLFMFSMLLLVLADSFLVIFVAWELVGLSSYLLIGFWKHKRTAALAAKKAFLVNRVGDVGFALGIMLIFVSMGTLNIHDFNGQAGVLAKIGGVDPVVVAAISLLIFAGAMGKSAQFPLHVWLPDAMEGPTPVSALIHAATMVTAGVYMVGRNAVLFSHAPMVMEIVAIVGVLTALMAASIGLVQYDIKRVLAYSTVSQLGYMFTAMGVGAFSAGAFHLMTHAFFKALLFLGSGSVIHAMGGEQDMRRMGHLRKYMPITFATMFIGTLAIAGIPPFAGFFSKDEILFQAFLKYKAIWVLAVATALMTAFYMFRLVYMTFYGEYRGPAWETAGHAAVATAAEHGAPHPADPHAHGQAHRDDHEVTHGPADAHGGHGHGPWHGPHESPKPMTYPLMALAVGAVLAGFVGIPAALGGGNAIEHFLEPSFTASHVAGSPAEPGHAAEPAAAEHPAEEAEHASLGVELGLMGFSVLIAIAGILLARRFYVTNPEISERMASQYAGPHRLLSNKYYVDELYNSTVISGTMSSGRGLWTFDRNVVDGAVNGTGWVTVISAWFSSLTDRTVVDGLVNLVGWTVQESSHVFRRLQTGLVQNYALLMLLGVFAFVSVYLFVR